MKIALSGKMASGKDTLGLKFKEIYPNALLLSFAEPLRNEIKESILKIKENNFEKPVDMPDELYKLLVEEAELPVDVKRRTTRTRRILQLYGTEYRRKQDNNYWVKKIEGIILKNTDRAICVTDARFINELQMLHDNNFNIVKIDISDEEQQKRLKNRDAISVNQSQHKSEHEFEKFDKFDYVLDNNSVEPKIAIMEILKYFNEHKKRAV